MTRARVLGFGISSERAELVRNNGKNVETMLQITNTKQTDKTHVSSTENNTDDNTKEVETTVNVTTETIDIEPVEFIVTGDSESEGVETRKETKRGTTTENEQHIYPTPTGIQKKDLDVKQWIENTVKLPEYYDAFVNNGYETIRFIAEINDAKQLLEIGIIVQEHQEQILEEIRTLKTENNENKYTKSDELNTNQKHTEGE
eukprot:505740_1